MKKGLACSVTAASMGLNCVECAEGFPVGGFQFFGGVRQPCAAPFSKCCTDMHPFNCQHVFVKASAENDLVVDGFGDVLADVRAAGTGGDAPDIDDVGVAGDGEPGGAELGVWDVGGVGEAVDVRVPVAVVANFDFEGPGCGFDQAAPEFQASGFAKTFGQAVYLGSKRGMAVAQGEGDHREVAPGGLAEGEKVRCDPRRALPGAGLAMAVPAGVGGDSERSGGPVAVEPCRISAVVKNFEGLRGGLDPFEGGAHEGAGFERVFVAQSLVPGEGPMRI